MLYGRGVHRRERKANLWQQIRNFGRGGVEKTPTRKDRISTKARKNSLRPSEKVAQRRLKRKEAN